MAEIDAYTTGLGNYPTAPDTSVETFLQNYQNGYYNTPYRKRLLQSEKPGWAWEVDDFFAMKSAYEQWKQQLVNKFDADKKSWEVKYNSPLNSSELLEAAGYNRNWMQGAANSQVGYSDQYSPMDSQKAEFSPSDSIVRGFGAIVDAVNNYVGIRDKEADINLKQAQAEQISALTPYKAMQSYISSAERGWRLYPDYFAGSPNKFPLDRGMTVSTVPVPDNSVVATLTELQTNIQALEADGKRLTNQQREWVVNTAQPLQEKMYGLQQKYMAGQISLQDIEKAVAEASKDARIAYGSKGMAQRYYLRYVDTFLNMINTGCRLYGTIKHGQDIDFGNAMDWMKATGEITEPLPGSLTLPGLPMN